MISVWNQELLNEKNVTLGFRLILDEKIHFTVKLAAASCYRLYVDGEFKSFGPHRAALGYARIYEKEFCGKIITVEVNGLNIKNFCWIKQPPFFACEIDTPDKKYVSSDFSCFLLNDRVQKVQRYAYQRGFTECYKTDRDRSGFYLGKDSYEKIETTAVKSPVFIKTRGSEPLYKTRLPVAVIDKGYVNVDKNTRSCRKENGVEGFNTLKPDSDTDELLKKYNSTIERGFETFGKDVKYWRDRFHYIGKDVEGFPLKSCREKVTDEISGFYYTHDGKTAAYRYSTFDFGKNGTGFTNLKISTKKPCTVYVIFDEILAKHPEFKVVDFKRNRTSNVHKWTFLKGGVFSVSTFEPYTMRYSVVVTDSAEDIDISFTDYENPDPCRFSFSCQDAEITEIVDAAKSSLAQNSVDLLSDCPSRERAGWLCDSYFSSIAEKAFTGKNSAEKALLENYSLINGDIRLPENMLPMNYPADVLNGEFIPNWGMWYILQVIKYGETYGNDELLTRSKRNVMNLLSYFSARENEFGLLENLDGWLFVEWGEANAPERVCGVNVPINIFYAYCLKKVGEFFQIKELTEKAARLKEKIIKLSYNGELFVDNLIRNKNDKLVQTNNFSENCQYFAFWFDLIQPKDYPALYVDFVVGKTDRKKDVVPSALFLGKFLRIDLLMRANKRKEILAECKILFGRMAKETGTLWEHLDDRASCCQAFPSYAIRWIVFALTGYDVLSNESTSTQGIGIDCDLKIPIGENQFLSLSVKDDTVYVGR